MQSRSAVTISNILDAAKKLFIEKQYADVTLKEITDAAGVTKGALYHHFSTKEELYSQMIQRCLAEVKEAIQESMRGSRHKNSRGQLQEALASFLRLSPDTRAVMRSIRRNLNIFEDPIRKQLIQAYQEALPEQIEAILRAGIASREIISMDARLLSWQHIAVVEVTLYDYDRALLGGPDEMAASIVSLFFDGIGSPEKP